MPSNQDFVDAARGWLGVPWLHQGRNRAGVDCVGLLLVCLEEIGLPAEDLQGYRRSPQPVRFVQHIRSQTEPCTETVPGAIGIFRGGTQPCHVGIFAEKDGIVTLIHAYAGLGVVMEEPFAHDWPNDLIELRRIGGLV